MHKNRDHLNLMADARVPGFFCSSLSSYFTRNPCVSDLHVHDYYTIILLNGGNGTFETNSNKYLCPPYSVCLIPPHLRHSVCDLANSSGVVLKFNKSFYTEEFSNVRLYKAFASSVSFGEKTGKPLLILPEYEFKRLLVLFSEIVNSYRSGPSDSNTSSIIRSWLNILLIKLSGATTESINKQTHTEMYDVIRICQSIDNSYIEKHQAQYYTSALHISEKKINQICTVYFNCSLKQLIKSRLLQEAKRLLESTNLNIAEISYRLKFEDDAYFNRFFRESTGTTPKRYRESRRELVQ